MAPCGWISSCRTGRAIRKPVVEAMLSHAGRSIGAGWVFGLNEALDQAGATIGPLLIALILFLKGGYRTALAYCSFRLWFVWAFWSWRGSYFLVHRNWRN